MDSQRRHGDAGLPTPQAKIQLPEKTKAFLGQLREEEVETLQRFSRLSKEEQEKFFAGVKFITSAIGVGRVMKWAILALVSTFFGFMLLWDQIVKFLDFIGKASGR